jgi:hypothetical protein
VAATSFLLLVLSIGGCGHGDRPKLGRVTGTVTLDGTALPNARVQFSPVAQDGGRDSVGFTDAEGRYELVYIRDVRGASVGEHVVRITTANAEEGIEERLPDCYHAETVLKETIDRGSNQIDFPLASD